MTREALLPPPPPPGHDRSQETPPRAGVGEAGTRLLGTSASSGISHGPWAAAPSTWVPRATSPDDLGAGSPKLKDT